MNIFILINYYHILVVLFFRNYKMKLMVVNFKYNILKNNESKIIYIDILFIFKIFIKYTKIINIS